MVVGEIPKPRQASPQSMGWFDVYIEIPHASVWFGKLVSAADFVFVIVAVRNPDVTGELPFIARRNTDVPVLKPFCYDFGWTRKCLDQRAVRLGQADLGFGRRT